MPDPIPHAGPDPPPPFPLMLDLIQHPPRVMPDPIGHLLAPLHAIALATCSKNAGEEEIE